MADKPSTSLAGESITKDLELTNKAQEVSKGIGNQVKDLKSQVLGPVSTAGNMIKDGVVKITNIQKNVRDVISNFKSTALGEISSFLSNLTGGWVDMGSLDNLIKFENGRLTFDTDGLMSNLSNSIGVDIRSFDALKTDLGNKLFDQFNEATGGQLGDLLNWDGESLTFNKDWRNDDIKQFMDLLDRWGVTGYDKTKDDDLIRVFNNMMLWQAVDYGMIEAFPGIYAQYENDAAAQAGVIDAYEAAIRNGDWYSLDALTKLLHEENVPLVSSRYPSIGKDFTSNYRFGKKDTVGMYKQLGEDIKNTLTKLSGRFWWLESTEYDALKNMALGTSMSYDSLAVFSSDNELLPIVASSGFFYEGDAFTEHLRLFPDVVVLRN